MIQITTRQLAGIFLAAISVLFALTQGSVAITAEEALNILMSCLTDQCSNDLNSTILLELRLPRTVMAFISGAALALSGLALQTVTRNPLADPYLFGISAGASLGAVLIMSSGFGLMVSLSFGAMAGSLFAVFLMMMLAGHHAANIQSLVLAGVAVSFMLSSLTSMTLYYSSPDVVASLMFWMMGSFDHINWPDLWLPALMLLLASAIFWFFRRWMDALLTTDQMAQSLGIPVRKVRLGLILVSALLTAIIVSRVGGIGFVGLMIPHIGRRLVGHQIAPLLMTTFWLGGIFMVWADVLSRTLLTDQQLPIGIVTASFGSVFFMVLLKQQQRSR